MTSSRTTLTLILLAAVLLSAGCTDSSIHPDTGPREPGKIAPSVTEKSVSLNDSSQGVIVMDRNRYTTGEVIEFSLRNNGSESLMCPGDIPECVIENETGVMWRYPVSPASPENTVTVLPARFELEPGASTPVFRIHPEVLTPGTGRIRFCTGATRDFILVPVPEATAVLTAVPIPTPVPPGSRDLRANFSPSAAEGITPFTVTFFDTSTGSPASWYWDFDDGVISTEQRPFHTFVAVAGPETVRHVTLTVRKGNVVSTITRDLTVRSSHPFPDFTANVTRGAAPLPVAFHDTSSGCPAMSSWDFGDGYLSNDDNPVHVYRAAGVFNASLTRITPWETASKNITITVG